MTDKNRRTVYSTDPEPEPPPVRATPAANLAAPFARQQGQPVIVGIERKGRGGKTVTVLQGVLSPPPGKEALAKLLKNRLGTGGTVKSDEIEIQGDHREQIVAILGELGYRAKKSGG